MDDSDRTDRVKGVLLAGACGDALGVPYETGKPSHGKAAMIGGGYGFEPGEYSDDTQQAVCVAVARSEPSKVAAGLLEWYGSHPRDIGNQTRAVMSRCTTPLSLVRASRAYARRQASQPVSRGWHPGTGNGSLMRTGPVCLPFLGDRKRIASVARKVSDLTHADPWSGDACTLWSIAISSAIELGEKFSPAMVADGIALLPAVRRGYWQGIIGEALAEPPARFRVNGSAVGAFQCALSAVAHADGLEDGLQICVAAGGDTDTTSAIAGALLGAMHGASAVPAKWRKAVHGWPGLRAAGLERLALEAASAQVSP